MATKRWAWLTACALLFGGLTNVHAHVHYCFDGREPPAAVHLTDGLDHHHDDGIGGGDHKDDGDHDDLDLDVPNQALAKSVKYDLHALEPLVGWAPAIDLQRTYASIPQVEIAPWPPPAYLKPQLRAPPR
jgi:hypothetical protein